MLARALGRSRAAMNIVRNYPPALRANWSLSKRMPAQGRRRTTGKRVLFVSQHPGYPARGHWTGPFEAALAKHLELHHGAEVHFAFDSRWAITHNVYPGFGFRNFYRLMPDGHAGHENLDAYVPFRHLATASACRQLGVSRIEGLAASMVVERYMDQGRRLADTGQDLFEAVEPDVVVTNHSTYVERGGVLFHLAISMGIPSATWQAQELDTFVCRRLGDSERFHHCSQPPGNLVYAIMASPVQALLQDELMAFLDRRRHRGSRRPLMGAPTVGLDNQMDTLEVPENSIGVFTHLAWDANGAYYTSPFADHRHWVESLVDLAASMPDQHFVFRIHPAEAARGTNEDTEAIIRNRANRAGNSANVTIIPSAARVSSYSLIPHLKAATTMRGTLAVELPCFGVPVVLAGTGPTSGLGASPSPSTIVEYAVRIREWAARPPVLENEALDRHLALARAFFLDHPARTVSCDDWGDLRQVRRLTPEAVTADPGLCKIAREVLGCREARPSTVS